MRLSIWAWRVMLPCLARMAPAVSLMPTPRLISTQLLGMALTQCSSGPACGAITADVLLLEQLIPAAREGLADLGVDDGDDGFINIVKARVFSRQTGAGWQRKAFDVY